MEPIRVSDPGSLIAVAEQTIGYQPTESIMAMLTKDKMLTGVIRMDLPTTEPDILVAAKEMIQPVVIMRTMPADKVILVGYSDVTDPEAALRAVGIFFETFDVDVIDHFAVQRRHWRSLYGQDSAWEPIPTDTPALVKLTKALGSESRRTRNGLVAVLQPDPALAVPVDEAPEGVDLAYCKDTVPLWTMVATDATLDLGPADIARLAHACDNLTFRDAVVSAVGGTVPMDLLPQTARTVVRPLTEHSATVERAPTVRSGVCAVASLVPNQPETVNLLATLGNIAWHCGDGTVAQVLLRRALSIDAKHRLSRLTWRMLELGVNPRRMQSLSTIPGL